MKIGNIIVSEGIDSEMFVNEFLNNRHYDKRGWPTEERLAIFRGEYIELHCSPLPIIQEKPST